MIDFLEGGEAMAHRTGAHDLPETGGVAAGMSR
jgi:hypothetical protein